MAESEAPENEAEILRRGVALLTDRLPSGWAVAVRADSRRVDALLDVSDSDGNSAMLIVDARRTVEGRDVASVREQIDNAAEQTPGAEGLVVARYLSPPVRAKLTDAGLSYIDATGNIRVELTKPGLYVSDRGADSDPWRGPGRPRGTLKGEPAAKVVRAIADFIGQWKVRDLVEVSGASTGSAYRVVDFLEREGMATRDAEGQVDVPDWAQVLRRWSDDYGFVRTNQVTRWIAPRGLPDLIERIAASDEGLRYAVTGTVAAAEWGRVRAARLAMIYVADPAAAAEAWDLRAADAGANVLLAQPKFDVVFERSLRTVEGVAVASPTQVVVDLMTGPGRNPSEAEELLEWMKRNEQSWRS